jgi:hypothetical protein
MLDAIQASQMNVQQKGNLYVNEEPEIITISDSD